MLTPYVFCWMFVGMVGAASFYLFTEESVTAVLGRNVAFPCSFSVPVVAVYWYRHEFSGAPDDKATVIASDFMGSSDPISGFERFGIGEDYRLLINDVSVLDETTYSCQVFPHVHEYVDERGYTNLRVIALANPQEPMISSCEATEPGRCTYIIGEDEEGVNLDCNMYNARPPASLMWTIGDSILKFSANQQIREKDGLSNTSSQLWVSRTELGETFVCEATGESVNGTTTLVATLATTATVINEIEGGLSSGAKAGIVTSLVALAMITGATIIILCHFRRKRRKRVRDPEELEHLIQGKTVTRASLGRAARLGALYDIRIDTFQNDSLFALKPGSHLVKRTDIGETKIEVTASDSFREKCDVLNVEAELEMSLLAGMVKLGSGAYLRDERKSARTKSMSLIYKLKTVNETVLLSENNLNDMDTLSTTNPDATHVVVGIDWGGQCTVTCEYENNESHDVTKIKREVSEELKKLKDALTKNRQTMGDTQEGGKKEFSFRCRSDMPAVDNDKPILYDGAVEFARSLSTSVQNTNKGKGVPVTYFLMPLDNFNRQRIYKEVDKEIVKETAQVLERVNEITQEVNDIRHDMLINEAFISYEGLWKIDRVWNEVTTKESHYKTELQKIVKRVRSGENRGNTLAQFLGNLKAECMLPSKYKNDFEPYLRKVKLIKSYVGKNIKYIGKEDKLVKDSKQNIYVLYVPQYSNVKVEEKNRRLFLRLSSTFSSNETYGFIVLYQETVLSHVWPHKVKEPTIKQYVHGTCECEDLYEEMGQSLEVCMIQVENPSPITSIPKDRTNVTLRCPNAITKPGSCAREVSEWRCSKCKQIVEYGTTTKLFYCSCGQSKPGDSQYRCNDLHHSIHFVMYPEDLLLSELSELKAMKEMNILIIGETEVGKSNWINSLPNYGSFATFTEAMHCQKLHVLIPHSSITQGDRSQTIKVQVTDNKENVNQLTTREPQSHVVNINDSRLCLIDTPSISEFGGSEQVKTWREKIMEYITCYSEINAICIILKPNNTTLTEMFGLYVEEFLAHLHISAMNNFVFCFTHTRPTLYKPGDTLSALNKELKKKNVGIQATKDNFFCFNNEPLQFLACKQHGVTHADGEATTYLSSWGWSVKETRRLLNYIESGVKPHKVKETLDVNKARRIIMSLGKPLVEVANAINKSLDESKETITKMSEHRTKLQSIREDMILNMLKGYDKERMELLYNGHDWSQACINEINRKCEQLKAENETILDTGAKFDSFLKTNFIKYNEPFVEYLEMCINHENAKPANFRHNNALLDMRNLRLGYDKKRKIIEKNTEENIQTLAQVKELRENLFKLVHFGSPLKALTDGIHAGGP